MAFILFLHCTVAILLMAAILMQSGKGGGLTEQFASAESIFGSRTNVLMVRATAILATIFIFTSISLAVLSSKQNESLMLSRKVKSAQSSAAAVAKSAPVAVAAGATSQTNTPAATQAVGSAAGAVQEPKPVSAGDAQKPQ